MGRLKVPVDVKLAELVDVAGQIGDRVARRGQANELVVVDDKEPISAVKNGRDVRGQQRHAVGRANNERRDPSRGDDDIRFVSIHDGEGKGPANFVQRGPHRLEKIEPALAPLFNSVRQHFSVGR